MKTDSSRITAQVAAGRPEKMSFPAGTSLVQPQPEHGKLATLRTVVARAALKLEQASAELNKLPVP